MAHQSIAGGSSTSVRSRTYASPCPRPQQRHRSCQRLCVTLLGLRLDTSIGNPRFGSVDRLVLPASGLQVVNCRSNCHSGILLFTAPARTLDHEHEKQLQTRTSGHSFRAAGQALKVKVVPGPCQSTMSHFMLAEWLPTTCSRGCAIWRMNAEASVATCTDWHDPQSHLGITFAGH
jgi:hypothetical protein